MLIRTLLLVTFAAAAATAQTTPPAAPPSVQAAPPQPARRPPPAQVMILTSPAWEDGGTIPAAYAQGSPEISPPLNWDRVPDETESFVLIMRDLDGLAATGTDSHLYWMLWNIPKDVRSLAEHLPAHEEFADGTRQISSSGPWYRGPAAPPPGPTHHYAFELYALSTKIDVPPVGQTPSATEAAVRAAMGGKIIGKGTLLGLYKRN